MTTAIDHDLRNVAAAISANIDKHFPSRESADRQVLCLAEEVGEFIGAYRRAYGMARRSGSFQEMRGELADVVIASYVAAHVLDVTVPDSARVVSPVFASVVGIAAFGEVLSLSAKAGQFVDAYYPARTLVIANRLTDVIQQAYLIASLLGMDLDAAISEKLQVIFTRGWKDDRT